MFYIVKLKQEECYDKMEFKFKTIELANDFATMAINNGTKKTTITIEVNDEEVTE